LAVDKFSLPPQWTVVEAFLALPGHLSIRIPEKRGRENIAASGWLFGQKPLPYTGIIPVPEYEDGCERNITNGDWENPDVSNGGGLRIHPLEYLYGTVLYCIMNSHFNRLQLARGWNRPAPLHPLRAGGYYVSAVPMK